jgi:hypothetical protein
VLNGWKFRLTTAILAGGAIVLMTTAACGGGGTKTPTAVPPTATPDAASAYKAQANGLVTTLGKQTDTALQDMQSAQTSQTDPKWATVLPADADLITATAAQLKALSAPAGPLAAVSVGLSTAADQLSQGAKFLKQSVQAADPVASAQAFAALTLGRGLLTSAATGLQ